MSNAILDQTCTRGVESGEAWSSGQEEEHQGRGSLHEKGHPVVQTGEEWREGEGEGEGEGENAQCKREVVQPGGGSIATYFKHLYMYMYNAPTRVLIKRTKCKLGRSY